MKQAGFRIHLFDAKFCPMDSLLWRERALKTEDRFAVLFFKEKTFEGEHPIK